ncbi:N-acetylneuraminate synthase family protein [Modestobacter sp. SYSU DS0875]
MDFRIGDRVIGDDHPTYFIADIAANHDGDLDRAKRLIELCAEAGADAAKFQNFSAEKIVSDHGFRNLGGKASHQASWDKSVVEVYQSASIPDAWTDELRATCAAVGVDYMSTPYDFEAIDLLDPHVPAFKVGSGDITWLESIRRIAAKGKPVLLATGASDIGEVQDAVHAALAINPALCLMQCNTNYTGSAENYDHLHLRVLQTYRAMFPQVVLGLSDHTDGHASVLGAIALGARVVEKHFTDDRSRTGPDHGFSMDPTTWRHMVDASRELERALGSGDKRVAANETETVVLQRRCLRAARDLAVGDVLDAETVDVLRPATPGALLPEDLAAITGRPVRRALVAGQEITWSDVD